MSSRADRFAAARAVADAVLYEGYVLYPYRASAAKNQARWQFGVLVPPEFARVDNSERSSTRTECLARSGPTATLQVRVRCLQVQHRDVERAAGAEFVATDMVEVGSTHHVAWDEAIEAVVDVGPLSLRALGAGTHTQVFGFPQGTDAEVLVCPDGAVAGRLVRRRAPIEGRVCVSCAPADDSAALTKVTVTVDNTTSWVGSGASRWAVVDQSLVAVHTMLAVDGGRFVSLLDPPTDAARAVAGCRNDGAFPVLIGSDDVVLSSPIILYDHPAVAPESPGDLYDATEIDEILALRVLTLTDQEKSEARGTDPRSAAIVDRCDAMGPDTWERLHATMKAVDPSGQGPGAGVDWFDPAADAEADPWNATLSIAGCEVARGSAVRLRPSHRGDAQDMFLRGMTATVAGVFSDVDGSVHVAVTVDDDPATEELSWQGRYLFFYPDEVEPLIRKGPGR